MAVTIPKPVPVMAGDHRQVEPQIEFDPAAFDPWRIQPVRHRLSNHPLFQPDALLALSSRLEAAGRIRTHANDATAGTPFNDAPGLHPNVLSAVETLSSLREARAWMSLLNVQTDAVYRELVGSVLDSVQPLIEPRDPGMCHRAGWIFVSSPKTVTPFHFDKEHNFILQIHGRKRVYVWDHRDTTVASELARDRFHQKQEERHAPHAPRITQRNPLLLDRHRVQVQKEVGEHHDDTVTPIQGHWMAKDALPDL